ncbi:MAG: glycosyltransferase [Thermodesulfobacteriota bacterium]
MTSYRIMRFSHLAYPEARNMFAAEVPDPNGLSYREIQEKLFSLSLVYSNSFSRAMIDLGNEAHEVVYDLEPMQKAWGREIGVKYEGNDWAIPIALRQIATLKPDVIFFQDMTLPYTFRQYVKDMFPFVRLTLGMRSFPSLFDELRGFDVFFTGAPLLVEIFKWHGLEARLLYHSFDDHVLSKLERDFGPTVDPDINFSFVGSSGCNRGLAQSDRYWALHELVKETDIKLWLDEKIEEPEKEEIPQPDAGLEVPTVEIEPQAVQTSAAAAEIESLSLWARMKRLIRPYNNEPEAAEEVRADQPAPEMAVPEEPENKRDDPTIPLRKLFPDRYQGTVFGLDMYRILRRSKVTFNRHVNLDRPEVGNMRMFEATGVGACLLTDTGGNIRDLFEPDQEVLTYESVEECLEKYRYLMEHENIRRSIAAAGQRRTLTVHTMRRRCEVIDEIIRRKL